MRYKLFGKHTGLRVSELVLGAGNFGTGWGHGAEPDEARRIFNVYAEAGGNFVDTADGYQFGQSEQIARLDEASAIPPVFPYTVINDPGTRQGLTGRKFEQFDAPAETVA